METEVFENGHPSISIEVTRKCSFGSFNIHMRVDNEANENGYVCTDNLSY